jgi:hypothetical protein
MQSSSAASGREHDDPQDGRPDSDDDYPYRPEIHGGDPFLDSLPTAATAPKDGPSHWGEWIYRRPTKFSDAWARYYSIEVVQHPMRGMFHGVALCS